MASTISNTFKDSIGILKAVGYRTFIERKWKTPQPMFNVLQVKDKEVDLFNEFLKKSLKISLTADTPISLGTFYSKSTQTFIYITHYPSTKAYLKVCMKLLTSGVSGMRSKATKKTNWIYCSVNETKTMSELPNVIMIGVNSAEHRFIDFISRKGIVPEAKVKNIKDVRGTGLSNYYFFTNDAAHLNVCNAYIEQGGNAIIYQAKK